MSRASELLALQTADDTVAGWQRQVAALEASIAGDPELDRLRQLLVDQERAAMTAQAAVRAADLELMSVRDRARALDRQLYGGSVRNPQELVTLQRELEAVRAHQGPLEDEELERMQEAENATAAVAETRLQVTTLEARRQELQEPDQERLKELRATLDDAQRDRASTAASLGAKDLELYERLQRRVRPAVTVLTNQACGNCRMPLGIQEARDVRSADRLVQCSSCDRVIAS